MYYVKNVSTGVVNVGNNLYNLIPNQEIYISTELYDTLKSELETYETMGLVLIDISPSYSTLKVRQPLSGVGQTLVPAQVLNGIIHRITTGLISDLLPSAASLLAALPDVKIGMSFNFYYSHALGGYPYVLLGAGSGMNFIDDFGYYSNAVEIRSGCIANLLLYVTSLSPAAFEIKVISLTGMLGVDGALAARFRNRVASTINTAGSETYNVTQLAGGMIIRDPAGAPRADATPTAAAIVSYMGLLINGGIEVGSFLEFTIKNIGIAPNDISLAQGAGVTIFGGSPITLTAGLNYNFTLIADNIGSGTEAVTIYLK